MKNLIKYLKTIDDFAKKILYAGLNVALIYYICAVLALWLAPYAQNYSGTMALFRCYLEAAPASFAAGVCAALICDLVIKKDLTKDQR